MNVQDSAKFVLSLVAIALTGVAAHTQSARALEENIHKAAIACISHAKEHGDVMPMDRLVKGIPVDDHSVVMFRFELLAWTRANSPIRWDSKGNPKQLKEGEADYRPYNLEAAEAVPFNKTEMAENSRKAAQEAAKRTLQPATFQMALNRAFGFRKWFNGLELPSEKTGDVRGVVEEDKTKIARLSDVIDKAIEAEFGVKNPNVNVVSDNKAHGEQAQEERAAA